MNAENGIFARPSVWEAGERDEENRTGAFDGRERRSGVPRTARENRSISARLRTRGDEPGAMPAAFDPRALSETLEEKSAPSRLTVRLAETPWDHLRAFHLVYAQYLPFGYAEERENRMRISPWNLTSRSHTFIAERGERVVGTLTCLEDGEEGLPADETYSERVRNLRGRRGKLLEVSALAIASDEAETTVVMELIRYLTTYSRLILKGSDWVITVNPRHVRFYEKAMLFEREGAENECRSANGAPGVLLRLDLETMPERYVQKYGTRSGARNLHAIFFEPTAEARRYAELQAAVERRRSRWEVTRQALALLQN